MLEVKVVYLSNYPDNSPALKHKEGDVCFDLRAAISSDFISINKNEIKMIPLGIKIELPEDYGMLIYPRSGLGSKGLTLSNNVGIIDNNYRSEIKAPIIYQGSDFFIINKGDRICQGRLVPINYVKFKTINEEDLSITDRSGGFGSTGRK